MQPEWNDWTFGWVNVKYEAKAETSWNICEYTLHWNTLQVHKSPNLFINKVEKDACFGAYPNPLSLRLEFGLIHTVYTCTQTVSSSVEADPFLRRPCCWQPRAKLGVPGKQVWGDSQVSTKQRALYIIKSWLWWQKSSCRCRCMYFGIQANSFSCFL